jgi:HK97 family phage portal protein
VHRDLLGEAVSLFFRRDLGDTNNDLIPPRTAGLGRKVSPDGAMRHSGVWASLRLRADLISMLPVDLFRVVDGVQTETSKPQILITPGALTLGGPRVTIDEWLWATQLDLDRYGNCFGIIVERDALMRPARIDLVAAGSVAVVQKAGVISYRIAGKTYGASEIWHEKQYVVPGLPVGLSPIAYAALSIGQYLSAQEFAIAWFSGTNHPAGTFKNVKKTLTPQESQDVKTQFKATVQAGDVLVHGADWVYDMAGVPEATGQFIDAQKWSIADACRFIGVPADMIDAESGGTSITYANIAQRNVQLLVINLGAPISRRERALSSWTAAPRFVKLNVGAFMRLDPADSGRGRRLADREEAHDERRGTPPVRPGAAHPEEINEFYALYGDPNKTPTAGSAK